MRLIEGKTFYNKPWYGNYKSMLERCYREKSSNYNIYGGRGIKVCDEWKNIENFEKWVEESHYKKGLTLDRIDVNGNYEPSNCRWVSNIVQKNNTRRNHYITYNGETHTIAEWARIYEVDYEHFKGKVRKYEKTDVNNIFKDLTRR